MSLRHSPGRRQVSGHRQTARRAAAATTRPYEFLDNEFQARFDLIRVAAATSLPSASPWLGPTPTPSRTPIGTVVVGSQPAGCNWTPAAAWDNQGAGHDAFGQSTLDQTYPPCSTVMVSSGSLIAPNGVPCIGGRDNVCVVVWTSTNGGEFRVTGLAPGAAWWSTTRALPKIAITDKAALHNPLGWFGPRNCSTGFGCLLVKVWIVNGDTGAVLASDVSRPPS